MAWRCHESVSRMRGALAAVECGMSVSIAPPCNIENVKQRGIWQEGEAYRNE